MPLQVSVTFLEVEEFSPVRKLLGKSREPAGTNKQKQNRSLPTHDSCEFYQAPESVEGEGENAI